MNAALEQTQAVPRDLALEQHYGIDQIAKRWHMSREKVRTMFLDEPDVLRWGSQESRSKRGYINLRVPESVVIRVHRRLRDTKKGERPHRVRSVQ